MFENEIMQIKIGNQKLRIKFKIFNSTNTFNNAGYNENFTAIIEKSDHLKINLKKKTEFRK